MNNYYLITEFKIFNKFFLRQKDREIEEIQKKLVDMGFNVGRTGIDGILGTWTLSAMDNFIHIIKNDNMLKNEVEELIKKSSENINFENFFMSSFKTRTINETQKKVLDIVHTDSELVNYIRTKKESSFNELKKKYPQIPIKLLKTIDMFNPDSIEFIEKVYQVSEKINCNPIHLLVLMYLESNLNPKASSKKSSAVGLIQFLDKTLHELGTSREKILEMTATEQMEYVEKFLIKAKTIAFGSNYNDKINLLDLYLLIFSPSKAGKRGILWSKDTPAAKSNPFLRDPRSGHISTNSISKAIEKIAKGLGMPDYHDPSSLA